MQAPSGETEGHTQTNRQTLRERQRNIHRQTDGLCRKDREADGQTDRWTDGLLPFRTATPWHAGGHGRAGEVHHQVSAGDLAGDAQTVRPPILLPAAVVNLTWGALSMLRLCVKQCASVSHPFTHTSAVSHSVLALATLSRTPPACTTKCASVSYPITHTPRACIT